MQSMRPPYLQMYHPPVELSSRIFNLFPALPPELRSNIWRHALNCSRIIKVNLQHRPVMDRFLARQGGWGPGKTQKKIPSTHEHEDYGVVVWGYQTISKLFCASKESRDAAMLFYRVKIPCWLKKGATKDANMKPGFLYVSPEFDFLHISAHFGGLPEFIHDLKTVYDPLGVGLLNLAVDNNGLTGGITRVNRSSLSPAHLRSFTQTLIQLEEVFFVSTQYTGRYATPHFAGDSASEDQVNSSIPVRAMAPCFDPMPSDPRPIDQDLSKTFMVNDPRDMICSWKSFCYNYLGGQVIPQTKYKVLLAFESIAMDLYTLGDGERSLQGERDEWMTNFSTSNVDEGAPSGKLMEPVPCAFGFWLFDVHAFGELPENPDGTLTLRKMDRWDLTEHPPELCLQHMR